MMVLGILLGAIGVSDLARGTAGSRGRQALLGALTIIGLGLLAGYRWHTVWLAVVGAIVVGCWAYAQRDAAWRFPGLTVAGVAALGAVALGHTVPVGTSPVGDWYASLDVPGLSGVDLDRFVLGLGAVLYLLSSANQVVRAVLDRAGPGVLQAEQTLRGGRLLGPMERVFVLSMALSGQYVALTALVAAKGIMRYPEISRDAPHGVKAEYVLVGSFVSWAQALVLVPLF